MDPWAVMMMNEPFLQICDPISIRLDLLFHPLSLFYLFLFSNCSPWEARTGQPIWDQAGLRTGLTFGVDFRDLRSDSYLSIPRPLVTWSGNPIMRDSIY
ncbi:uncharacterized protein AFUA_2G07700 [Aspergillus fumigatus Af293]|uniref:Uncharacterized protein n=2 Tax=Aspergillus fumigatus TaxID=746128 RepID=Q4X248_ASPFU|nr:hypothetical protein AFUA_2G07700 [Aspergillus fumigatus Af293]EAL93067.1 hypothetical protein AFUA_2G07700 [Aspergillus fumigatus Af293]EDP54318.1 hypothetical protein AFUB_023740 [Aspergillus fumigatus A1163]